MSFVALAIGMSLCPCPPLVGGSDSPSRPPRPAERPAPAALPSLAEVLAPGGPTSPPGREAPQPAAPSPVLGRGALQGEASSGVDHAAGASADHASSDRFHFTTLRAWAFRDFLPEDDEVDVLGLEFNSAWGWGSFDVTNI